MNVDFVSRNLAEDYDGTNYGQRFLTCEWGNDHKWHFKFTVHPSRTSLVSDFVTSVVNYVKAQAGYSAGSLLEDIVIDFYLIGDWTKTGRWTYSAKNGHCLEYIK